MATKYGMSFRGDDARALASLTVQLRDTSTGTYYSLTNSGADKSFYFHSNIPDGIYDVYISGVAQVDLSPVIINNEDDGGVSISS